jgi:hypothetical protein
MLESFEVKMRWLLNLIVELFQRAAVTIGRRRISRQRQEDLYASGGDREETLSTLRNAEGFRKRTVHMIGPRVSSDAIGYEEEQVQYVDDDNVQTEINYRFSRRCACGNLVTNDNWILGACNVCGRILCRAKGCGERCEKCGDLVCRRHAVKFGKHTFCSAHSLYGWWLWFWGCL